MKYTYWKSRYSIISSSKTLVVLEGYTIPHLSENLIERLAPAIFVVLWSTGFIGAKYGLPYIEPFTFLSVRLLFVVAIFTPIICWITKAPISISGILHSMFAGFLIHGVYLGGIFYVISEGMSAGVSSIIVALQPLITVYIASLMLGEKVTGKQFIGLIAALVGVVLVVSPKLFGGSVVEGATFTNLAICCAAILAICVGTIYQKKYVTGLGLRVSTFAQYIGALIPLALMALVLEERTIIWSGEFIFALSWLVLVLSFGAVTLLMFLIRRNSAASTASLFYLVPVSTAVIAYFLFGETLQTIQLVGMGVIILALIKTATKA